MERRQVRYSGRVQGVGFRATARSIARAFPVTGWVRNEPDGDVLLEAQGTPEAIESFLDAVRKEMGAQIAHENVQVAPLAESEASFEIRL